MKKIFLIIGIFSFLFLAGCTNFENLLTSKDPLLGTWSNSSKDEYLVFKDNNIIEILDENMENVSPNENISTKYESITEIEPYQLYVTVEFEGKIERMPLGIYKIENRKLIIGKPFEYHRTIGVIDVGVSRYEIPKDFSGIVTTYEKID